MIANILTAALFVLACHAGRSPTPQDMTRRRVLYRIPDMDRVQVRRGVVYKTVDQTKLSFDIYYPPGSEKGPKLPAVIFVLGFADAGSPQKLKDWGAYVSWAELIAASGMIAVTYETRHPASDFDELITYIRSQADALNVDEEAFGLWSCSANVPTALTILLGERRDYIRCGVLYYGLMLTPDQKYRENLEAVHKSVKFSIDGLDKIQSFHKDLPLVVVRAGRDNEMFNRALDHFVAAAISHNAPLTLVNYPEGRHAFDIYDDNRQTREIIKETVEFLRSNLVHRDDGRRP